MRDVFAAAAQRGGHGDDDVMLEHGTEEFPCALSGHITPKEINLDAMAFN
ncbi:unnamed protein product [Linum tenue]|uniref:Uncharacterized protein n=1 Tax=Linum tenue TaxID=586396 RepID=A0AAV0J9V7_9ROSI|nr:unnamed protein product [Linum tenue]